MMHERSWKDKTSKEKLDMIFVTLGIVAFAFTVYESYKRLKK